MEFFVGSLHEGMLHLSLSVSEATWYSDCYAGPKEVLIYDPKPCFRCNKKMER